MLLSFTACKDSEKPTPSATPISTVAVSPTAEATSKATSTPLESALTCTLTIDCTRILENMDKFNAAKKEFLPKDGIVVAQKSVSFKEGETVLDMLKSYCEDNKIQIEALYTEAYKSYYIKGINQIYEKDCGEESGWAYFVNDVMPTVDAGSYVLKAGDKVGFIYFCSYSDSIFETPAP